MKFLFFDRMWERVERSKESSDTEIFYSLMLAGELLTKMVALYLTAAIKNEPERYRYQQLYRLVRADGIGEWDQTISSILIGPPAQYLCPEIHKEFNELIHPNKSPTWQYEAVQHIHSCVRMINPKVEPLSTKVEARKWFSLFAQLRNKTRGHGAELPIVHSQISNWLDISIRLWTENFSLFKRPWAYLHQNLSGKYRVTKLTSDTSAFDHLKSTHHTTHLPDGVYVHLDLPIRIELLESDVEATDFFLPNGDFKKNKFELLSYVTGVTKHVDGVPYLSPIGSFPRSETQGLDELDLTSHSFSNLPPEPTAYIHRNQLERELTRVIESPDRYPIITLVGRGGIGKTYLASKVLYDLAKTDKYGAIFWFSARDIDLLPSGPKPVKPHVLTTKDIAKEFCRLIQPLESSSANFDPVGYMQRCMTKSQPPLHGLAIIFVFDNFETVDNPDELFMWIDTYIRAPNKVLITTRHRDFKGDYPVEVRGMSREEFDSLVDQMAHRLGIIDLLNQEYLDELYAESEGHPYVIKILLGEVAKLGQLRKISRILADKDYILEALFERTYVNLSLVAQRVFLTLCSWRSLVPQVALEAVLLRPGNERMNVQKAIDELVQSSFVEISVTNNEDTLFLSVPLVAKLFGSPKLRVSPIRSAIESDMQLLQAFGAASQTDVQRGFAPRINALVRFIDEKITRNEESIDKYKPVLEFVARKYPSLWLQIATLYDKHLARDDWQLIEQALRKYLEYNPSNIGAWNRLSTLYQRLGDEQAEINALVSMCLEPDIPYEVLSNAANSLNRIFHQQPTSLDAHEKSFMIGQLVDLMEKRITEADGDDCARLAWLFLHLQEIEKARSFAQQGRTLEPDNIHCANVLQKLSSGGY